MAIVKRFNVNREQVTLDPDIIENMSANNVSYDDSSQYDENTVGEKLSELNDAINITSNNSENLYRGLLDLEYGSLDENGEPNGQSKSRKRSKDFISVPTIDGKPINISITINSAFSLYVYQYNENKQFITYSHIITSRIVTLNDSTRYIKFIFIPIPDNSNPDWKNLNVVITVDGTNSIQLLESFENLLNIVGHQYKEDNVTISSKSRVDFNSIILKAGTTYTIQVLAESDINLDFYIYNYYSEGYVKFNNSGIKEFTPTKTGTISLYNYLSDSTTISFSILEKGSLVQLTNNVNNLIHLNVSEWNWGLLNNGVVPFGIPDEDVDNTIPNIKKLLISLNADILISTEYSICLDRSWTRNTYNELLKQFYPYQYYGEHYIAVFSKIPLILYVNTAPSGIKYLFGEMIIGSNVIGFGVIHPRSASGTEAEDERIADHQYVINHFSGYTNAIVGGDFNTYVDRELDVYRSAGWNLGNCGYFGDIDTYRPDFRPWYVDNIVTKGINIDDFKKIDNRADVSDHYPVISKLSYINIL